MSKEFQIIIKNFDQTISTANLSNDQAFKLFDHLRAEGVDFKKRSELNIDTHNAIANYYAGRNEND